MNRTHPPKTFLPAALVAVALLSLAACGDDSDNGSAGTTPPTVPEETLPTVPPTSPTTPPADGGIEHPTGADDVVVRIAYEGGFVPVDVAFLNLPTLLVTGDGRAIVQGPVIAIYPGPLLPNMQVRQSTEDGVQALLALAEEHGLFAEVEYSRPDHIADAPDTVVQITANGETYVHRAYALNLDGSGEESDPQRQALADFVAAATGDWMYGDNPELGPEEQYTSDTFLIRASVAPEESGEIPPTIVEWPADASVRLADAAECAEVPAAEVADLFADATQLTYFTDGDVTYQIAAKPLLPGDSC